MIRKPSGFTLIELLVVVAMLGVVVAIGVGTITAGQGAARVKGAARDVYAAIRQARSIALVTGQPAVITYSTENDDGEVLAKIEVTSVKLVDSQVDRSKVVTLSGDPLKASDADEGNSVSKVKTKAGDKATQTADDSSGETLEDILFAPIKDDVVKGMRLKVLTGDEAVTETAVEQKRTSKISVFSTSDYILERFKSKKATEEKATTEKKAVETTDSSSAVTEELQAPVRIVWETNGRVEPHKVWVYPDGKRPEDGLLISIDRFGAAKITAGDGREE